MLFRNSLVFSVPLWIALKALKWHLLLNSYWKESSFSLALNSFLCGFSFGLITPGKVGELSRVLYLPFENRGDGIGLIILDRYCDLIALLFLAVFGVTHFAGFLYGFLVFLSGAIAASLFFLFPHLLELLCRQNKFASISNYMNHLRKIPPINSDVFFRVLVISFSCFVVSVATSFSLLLSFGDAPLSTALTVFPLTLLTNVLPITIGNLGVREGATIYLLGQYGLEKEVAFHVSILLFVLHSVIPALLGSIIQPFTRAGRKVKDSQLDRKATNI